MPAKIMGRTRGNRKNIEAPFSLSRSFQKTVIIWRRALRVKNPGGGGAACDRGAAAMAPREKRIDRRMPMGVR
jgi:hypothetical protein